MKQETLEDVHTSDVVAFIEEIKEVTPEHAMFKSMYLDGDLHRESIDGHILEVEVSSQSSVISRSVTGLDRTLETNGENDDQINEEVDFEVSKTNDMIFENSEASKKSIEEIIREYGNGSDVGIETSHEIDNISLDNIIVEKLRERGSLRTQQGDNLHGSTDGEKSLSFEEGRGVRKKMLRVSPRCGSKLR
uniref:Uncharacterized protein n=1 Tax=Solanum tuberosum TaxID=4113 RepID=M1DWY1_SOLTU